MRDEQVLGEKAAVDGQAAEHQRVHEDPADEGGRRALVETADALVSHGLDDALQGPGEARCVGGLEADLDCVEGMADRELGNAGKHAGYEALVVLDGRCGRLLLLVGRHTVGEGHICDKCVQSLLPMRVSGDVLSCGVSRARRRRGLRLWVDF